MSRKRQTVFYIIIILLIGVCYFAADSSYTSPEAVLYACEKGLHYGPSEKILHIERQDTNALVIGKCGDGLSSVPAYRTGIGTWKLGYDGGGTGVEGYTEVNGITAVFDRNFKAVYGMNNIEDAERVKVVVGYNDYNDDGKDYVIMAEINLPVDSDGFFFDSVTMNDVDFKTEDIWPEALEIYGYDENGEVIYFTSVIEEIK